MALKDTHHVYFSKQKSFDVQGVHMAISKKFSGIGQLFLLLKQLPQADDKKEINPTNDLIDDLESPIKAKKLEDELKSDYKGPLNSKGKYLDEQDYSPANHAQTPLVKKSIHPIVFISTAQLL